MQNGIKRVAAAVLAAVMFIGMLNLTAFAEEETATKELVDTIIVDPLHCQSSKSTVELASLASGTHVKWIDRLIMPEYALDFYHWMEENTDGDGVEDALITDEGFQNGTYFIGEIEIGSDYEQWNGYNTIVQNCQLAYECFERDHPEVFWLNGMFTVMYEIYGVFDGNIVQYSTKAKLCYNIDDVKIRMDPYTSEAAIRADMALVASRVEEILEGAGDDAYSQIRYFNKYLTEHNEYNTIIGGSASGDVSGTIWKSVSALDGRTGTSGPVCEGYARAFKVLCDRAGIPCVLVDNNFVAGDPEPHMWNNVCLDGAWYGVDVTWNDPLASWCPAPVSGYENENYLLVGSNTVIDGESFASSHPEGNSPSGLMAFTNGPKISSDKYTPGGAGHTHKYRKVVTPPNCTEQGYTTFTCDCGDSYKENYVKALGHNWVVDREEKDQIFYSCAYCGETKSEAVGDEEWPFVNWEWEVLKLVNKVRYEEGVDPVTGFALLQAACDIREKEIAQVFSHTRPDGTSCFTAMDEVGLYCGAAGENIAAGQVSPEEVMFDENYGWMYSSGHRANILDPDFEHMGVGYYYSYDSYYMHHWVQMFASHYYAKNESFDLVFPSGKNFPAGTALDEMGIYAEVENSIFGTCYLPIIAEYCTGYHENAAGDQTVTVSVLGFQETFVISRGTHTHSFGEWYESASATCTQKGEERRDCTGCDQYETREVPATEHAYQEQVIAPTCTEEGCTTYTCAGCGDSYQESIPAIGHNYKETVTAPTCTGKGYTTYTCVNCGHVYEDNYTSENGHSYKEKVIAPTCTEEGVTVFTCEVCGYSYEDFVVGVLDHSWDEGEVTKEPTEQETGIRTFTCTACGKTKEETIPVLDHVHKYAESVTAPTCTEQGYTVHTCTCGESYKDNYVEATGHNYKESQHADPACENEGYSRFTCAGCGDSYQESIPAIGHDYKETVTAPTCTKEGYTTYTCANCGKSYVDNYTGVSEHSYEKEVIEPTCTKEGFTIFTCEVCGYSYEDFFVGVLEHSWDEGKVTKEATEQETGIRVFTCTACGQTREEIIPTLDHVHKLGDWEVYRPAACDVAGEERAQCAGCDYYESRAIPAAGHDYQKTVIAPTCTEQGYTMYSCSKCTDTYQEDYTDPTGHDYKETITAPTCTKDGYTTYTCACGHSYQDDHKTAFGHNYEKGICIICGGEDPEYVPESFEFVGSNMTLGNALDMNFFVNQSDIEGADNYAVITKHYADGRDDKVVKIPQSQWEKLGSTMYYFTFSGVTAKEMGDEFEVVIYNADGEAVSEVKTDSIQAYSRRMLDKADTKETAKSLYVEMLNYGAAAQVKFKYNTENLVNNVVTAEEQETYGISKREYENIRQTADGYIGTSLTLESRILFNVVFDADYVTEGSYTIATFINHNGKEVEDRADTFAPLGKYLYASFTKMSVADRSQPMTITLYDAEGNAVVTVQDTVEGYVARMDTSDPLYEAIMKFADAAYQYFHS